MGCIGDCNQGRTECETPELCQPTMLDQVLVISITVLSVVVVIGFVLIVWGWL